MNLTARARRHRASNDSALKRLLLPIGAVGLLATLMLCVAGTAFAGPPKPPPPPKPPKAPACAAATNVPNFLPDPVLKTNKDFEENLAEIPSTSDTTGIDTNSSTSNSATSPGLLTSFAAEFAEETELYEYANNNTTGPTPNGSPGAYDATQPILNSLPTSGTITHANGTTTAGAPGLPYAVILNSSDLSFVAGPLPVTISQQNYTPNPIAWMHGTQSTTTPAGQPSSTDGCKNLDSTITFSAPTGLAPNTVYAAYLLVRDTDTSGPLSNHIWYFKTPPAPPTVYLGYADSYPPRGITSSFPSPWAGGANVVFVGCGFGGTDACPKVPGSTTMDWYDDGAIRIDNTTGATMTFNGSASSVTVGYCTYTPWNGMTATVNPGQTLILSQTGVSNDPCGPAVEAHVPGAHVVPLLNPLNENLDTSESYAQSLNYLNYSQNHAAPVCSNDGLIPTASLSINGSTMTITDNNQILNTGGVDLGGPICGVSFTASSTNGSNVLTNVQTSGGGTTGLAVGNVINGAGFPNGFTLGETITNVDPVADTITVSVAANADGAKLNETELFNESTQWTQSGVVVS